MAGHTDRVWALARCDDDTLASASSDKSVRLWRPSAAPAEARPLSTLSGHRGAVHALATHRGLLLSGSADQSVKLWDIAEGSCVGTLWQVCEHVSLTRRSYSVLSTLRDVSKFALSAAHRATV